MRLRQLEYLDAVLQHKSLTKAAASLFVSVPTLSQQIRLLEDELGITLINRIGRGMAATAEGGRLVTDVRKILSATLDLTRHARDLAQNLGGELRVGTTHSAAITVLPSILQVLGRRHQGVLLRIDEGSSSGILNGVVSGDLDVGLIAVSPIMPLVHPNVEMSRLLHGELMVCCSTKVRHHNGAVRLADLSRMPLILFHKGTLVYDLLQKLFPPEVLTSHSTYYTDNTDSAREMVSRGMGVAFLPDYAATVDIYYQHGLVQYVRLVDPRIEIGIGLIWNQSRYVPALVHEFQEVAHVESRRFLSTITLPDPWREQDTVPARDPGAPITEG